MPTRRKFYKKSDKPPKDNTTGFVMIDGSRLTEGAHILGFDPPSGTNFGWAVMKYSNGHGQYVQSGLEKIKPGEADRLVQIYEFIQKLAGEYSPSVASVMERSIGFGWAPAREKLGENTGIIKFSSIMAGAEIKPIHTTSMGDLFCSSGGMKRADKKTAIQTRAKELFPISLKAKKITKTGAFTHEADAIGFCCSFFIANNIPILTEEEENVIA